MSQSLVSVAQYRSITRDTTTEASLVEDDLARALRMIEDELLRPLSYGRYTEVHVPGKLGEVYPKAWPVLAVEVPTTSNVIASTFMRYVEEDPNPDDMLVELSYWGTNDAYAPGTGWATVTYIGGYTSDTLPETLRVAIAVLARALGSAGGFSYAGAKQVTLGDATIVFGANGVSTQTLDGYVPGLSKRISKWKYKS